MWIDDLVLLRASEALCVDVWIPTRAMVVLGSSNEAERECYAERCQADAIPILKRAGGGGTVLLHPGCVVVTVAAWVAHPYRNDFYFRQLNAALIRALASRWPELSELTQKGLSDLAYGNAKVAGTSLFRSRGYLLYQASLLVEARVDAIAQYLSHPSREPDYRAGKSHRAFLTDLSTLHPGLSVDAVARHLNGSLAALLSSQLADELVSPQESHLPHLCARVKSDSSSVQRLFAEFARRAADGCAHSRTPTRGAGDLAQPSHGS